MVIDAGGELRRDDPLRAQPEVLAELDVEGARIMFRVHATHAGRDAPAAHRPPDVAEADVPGMFLLVEDLRGAAVKLDPCACVGLRRRFGPNDRRGGADVVTRAR